MKSKWSVCKLQEIISFKNGKKKPSEKGNIPVYGGNGILGYVNQFNLKKGIAIGRVGAYCGSVYYSDKECWISDNAIQAINNTNSDMRFDYYLLNYLRLNERRIGTGQPLLTQEILNRIEIKCPPLQTQKKIAAVLSALDDKIELNNKINENLEQQAQAIFKSWFVDFEPFDEEFIDSPIGTMIPKSLKMLQIANIPHDLETGKRPKGGAVTEGIPSVGAENVKKLGEFNPASAKFIPYEFAAKMKKGKINGYELLLYKDGGKPGTFIPHFSMFGENFPYKEFFINEHVFKLDFYDRGLNEFMYFYLQTDYPYNWLANNGGKAAVPGINQQDVNAIWCFEPSHPMIKKFCEWVQPLFVSILSNCAQNMKLSALRDTLLPKLRNGEIDVSEVKI